MKLHDYFNEKHGKNLMLDDDVYIKLHGVGNNLNEHAAVPYGCSLLCFKYGKNHFKNFAFVEKSDYIDLYIPKEDFSFKVTKIDTYKSFGFVLTDLLYKWVKTLPEPDTEAEIKLIWKD